MKGFPIFVKTYPKEDLKKVKIETLWGDVSFEGADTSEIKIEVFAEERSIGSLFQWEPMNKADFENEQYRIIHKEGVLSVRSKRNLENRFSSLLRFKKVSFRVTLPVHFLTESRTYIGDIRLHNLTGTQLLNTRFGRIEIQNLNGRCIGMGKSFGYPIYVNNCHGEMKLSTTGGNIKVSNSSGEQEYRSGGGNISLTDYTGKIAVKTHGGNITGDRLNGEIKMATLGGNIRLNGLDGNLAANTKGGNLRVDADYIAEYLWLETSGGNVRLTFPDHQGMDLTAKGNRVRSFNTVNFQGTKRHRRWIGQVNNGGAEVKLHTSGGYVRLYSKPTVTRRRPNTPPEKAENFKIEKVETFEKSSSNVRPVGSSSFVQTNQKRKSSRNKWKIPKRDKKSLFERLVEGPSLSQAFLSLLVISFFVYGINTIVFFTFEIFNAANSQTDESTAILCYNLVNGFIAFFTTWLFIVLINKYIRNIRLKYLVLVLFCYVTYFAIHGLLIVYVDNIEPTSGFWYYYDYMVTDNKRTAGSITPIQSILFTGIPSFAACCYFAYWQRGHSLSEKITEQEYELLSMEKLKTKAQLTALEARINPHFLYNSLNSIAGLIHEDQDKAEDMTVELSKLFRATTGRTNESHHTIEEELNLVKSYLAIEQMRFGDRLTYEVNLDEKLSQIKIPRFLLQPLVENAIKHGISKIATNGLIKVDIQDVEDKIQIDIHDNGPDFGEAVSGGYGLKSVRDKLSLIYGKKASLNITNEPIKNIQINIDKDHDL